jgi:hypothetical protein
LSVEHRTGEIRKNGEAIATICVGVCCLVANDAMAKWLTTFYDPLQIVFLLRGDN